MAETTQFELVTPEALALSTDVGMVVLPGEEGDLGVLPLHSPLVTSLRPGLISLHESMNGPAMRRFFVSGGLAEIDGTHCNVLAEEAMDLAEADVGEAQARLSEARAALDSADGEAETAQAQSQVEVAEALVAALAA